jgi:hypothetical protein
MSRERTDGPELTIAKRVRRQRWIEERESMNRDGLASRRFVAVDDKLRDIEEFEREQVRLLSDILDVFAGELRQGQESREAKDRHRQPTGPGRHLRLVRD